MNSLLARLRLLLLATVVLPAPLRAADLPALQALSGAGSPVATAAGDSSAMSFSSDGRYLLFLSNARDLSTSDEAQPTLRLYRHELSSGTLIRVGEPPAIPGGDPVDILDFSVSASGEQVTVRTRPFATWPDRRGRVPNEALYWLDLNRHQTVLLNPSTNGINAANRPAVLTVMSADGRWVAFESQATDLVPFTTVGTNRFAARSIYLRDITRSETLLVNPAVQEGAIAGDAYAPSLSSDGSRMAFVSHALDLLGLPARVYVRDNRTGDLLWIGSNYSVSNSVVADSLKPRISGDGRWVWFAVAQSDGSMASVIHDLETGIDHVFKTNEVRSIVSNGPGVTGQLAIERTSELGIWDPAAGLPRWLAFANGSTRTTLSPPALVRLDQTFNRAVYVGTADSTQPGLPFTSQVFLLNVPSGTSEIISLNPTGSPGSQASILDLALSPDGRWVAFAASDTDLVPSDANHAFDLFLYDVSNREISLISRHQPGLSQPIVHSIITGNPSLSADNQLIAFSASDGNRVADDTNGIVDVFLQNRRTGQLNRLSGGIPTEPGIRTHFQFPKINRQGTHASFLGMRTAISNNVPLLPRLFAAELATGEVVEVPDYSTNQPLVDNFVSRSIKFLEAKFSFSKDGQWLLHTEDQLHAPGIDIRMFHLRDRTNRVLISFTNRQSVVVPTMGAAPRLSSDGSKLWFFAFDRQFAPTWHFDYRLVELDIARGTTKTYEGGIETFQYLVSENENTIVLVSDFSANAYDSLFIDNKTKGELLLRDYGATYGLSRDGRYALGSKAISTESLSASLTRLDIWTKAEVEISKPTFFNRSLPFGDPILSADGRYVVFPSQTDQLTPNDSNSLPDIFVRDAVTGTTVLISANRLGTQAGNQLSTTPTLAPDGRTVVFRSWATDLVSGQTGSLADFYLLTLPTTDTDVDGMADDWEMAYFNTLDRDGSGDFDADGHSDRAEFEAGTTPTNGQSVLRVLTLQKAGSGPVEVLWASEAGKLYELQVRDSATEGDWISLGTVRAATTTHSWTDPNPTNPPHRFYRVLVQE